MADDSVFARSGWLATFLSVTIVFLLLVNIIRRNKARNGRRPPGPPGWPVIGNMLELGDMPHRSLFKLKARYGPVIWLKLGAVNTIVVQSAKAAEELFKNHDLAFADRKTTEALTAFRFNECSIATNIYSPYWRLARKISASELLSNVRLNETAEHRRKSIDGLMKRIEGEIQACGDQTSVEMDIGHLVFRFYFGLIGNLTLSRDVLDDDSDGPEFFEGMVKFMELATAPNVADFLPFLKWLDLEGIKRSMVREMGRCNKVSAKFVNERVEERKAGVIKKVNKDMLDILLDSQGDQEDGKDINLTDHDIIILIMETFLAGSETTSSSIEWAMATAMHYPDQREKIGEEMDRVIGKKRMVEESDIDNLPNLCAFVKETFRLYVTAPFLPLTRGKIQTTWGISYPRIRKC